MLKFVLSFFVFLISAIAVADAPSYVRVRNIAYAGSGCPAGTVAGSIANDRQAFTLLFDSYIAEVGPGISIREKRKNCQLAVALDFPQGWSFSIFTVDYRGYVDLDGGIVGTQQSSYYFQGQSTTARLASNYYGPLSQNYQIRDTLGISAVVWSPCGASRALNINTEVRLNNSNNPTGSGIMTTDSIDGVVRQLYGFQWRRC